MTKKVTQSFKLTDHQVRILAEASRMGLFEMIVKLSTISAVVKVAHHTVTSVMKSKTPPKPVYVTQHFTTEADVDHAEVARQAQELLAGYKSSDKATWSEETDPVETPDNGPGQYDTPKVEFEIPQQASAPE